MPSCEPNHPNTYANQRNGMEFHPKMLMCHRTWLENPSTKWSFSANVIYKWWIFKSKMLPFRCLCWFSLQYLNEATLRTDVRRLMFPSNIPWFSRLFKFRCSASMNHNPLIHPNICRLFLFLFWCQRTNQGLVTVPFWEYWTSPYSSLW